MVYLYIASGIFFQFANLNMSKEIVDLPIKKMVMFHCYVNVYQRVKLEMTHDETKDTRNTCKSFENNINMDKCFLLLCGTVLHGWLCLFEGPQSFWPTRSRKVENTPENASTMRRWTLYDAKNDRNI